MWQLISGDPLTIFRWCGPMALAGLGCGFAVAYLGLPGVVTCTVLLMLGAAAGSLEQYRAERGLWMLAALWIVIFTATYLMFSVGRMLDVARNAPALPIGLLADFAIATALLTASVRFLWRIVLFNWSFSRSRQGQSS